MEKQLERHKEPEPVQMSRQTEEMWLRREQEKRHAASLPHVIQFDDVPWVQMSQAFYKGFTGAGIKGRLDRLPLYTMTLRSQILKPGGKSGKHRHFNEAILYIMEGEAYDVHDGEKHTCGAGDIICVPTYTVHQHFNASADKEVKVFFSTPGPVFELAGLDYHEQIEMHEDYRIPEGATPLRNPRGQIIGYRDRDGKESRIGEVDEMSQSLFQGRRGIDAPVVVRNTYDYYKRDLVAESRWHHSLLHVVKQSERPWEDTDMGRLKYLAHWPTIPSGLRLSDCFIQEIPPGGHSGKHRHVSEEAHLILEGRGYDIHDGVRWDWKKDSIVCIPVNTTHQHFNSDPAHPARFLSFQSRFYHYLGHGGFEHLEDATDITLPIAVWPNKPT